jgi:hypothetical protein
MFSDPLLRRPMPGHRGQEHLSLSGALGGMGEPNHLGPEPLGASMRHDAGPGGAPFKQYDPIVASYESNAPKYSPPAPWFEGMTELFSPPEPVRPDWPSPHLERQEPVQYQHSLLTPAVFQQLMEEVPTAGPVPTAAKLTLPEIMRSTGAASTPEVRSAESLWTAPKLLGDHPCFGAKPISSDPYAAMMPQATIPHEPLAQMAPQETLRQGVCEQQPQDGLEAVIRRSMPLQPMEDPFEREQRMLDQQTPMMERLMNPFIVPGFGPGA